MSKLFLLKNASPEADPAKPPEQWHLSERGRASCAAMAEKLRPLAPSIIISSEEIKAIETAELLAAALGIAHKTSHDLYEHDRSNVPQMRPSEFISMIELFFRRPTELVLGDETAEEAEERFTAAVRAVVKDHPEQDIAIVAHSTVIALLLASLTKRPGFQLWRELGQPSIAALNLNGGALEFTELSAWK